MHWGGQMASMTGQGRRLRPLALPWHSIDGGLGGDHDVLSQDREHDVGDDMKLQVDPCVFCVLRKTAYGIYNECTAQNAPGR
jgi:hypothetical protein